MWDDVKSKYDIKNNEEMEVEKNPAYNVKSLIRDKLRIKSKVIIQLFSLLNI